jgi:hypothetical protein
MAHQLSFAKVLTDRQLQALGEVVVEAAWMERIAEYLISKLCRLTPLRVDVLLESKMISSKLEAVRQLGKARLKTDAARQEFFDLIAEAKTANTDRSTLVHGLWTEGRPGIIDGARGIVAPATVKKTTSPGNFKTMNATQINEVAKRLNAANWKLILFTEQHWPRLSVWYRKPPPPRHKQLARALRNRRSSNATPPKPQPQPSKQRG